MHLAAVAAFLSGQRPEHPLRPLVFLFGVLQPFLIQPTNHPPRMSIGRSRANSGGLRPQSPAVHSANLPNPPDSGQFTSVKTPRSPIRRFPGRSCPNAQPPVPIGDRAFPGRFQLLPSESWRLPLSQRGNAVLSLPKSQAPLEFQADGGRMLALSESLAGVLA
jgi:hypothetical protein